jgi:hypothetical protein
MKTGRARRRLLRSTLAGGAAALILLGAPAADARDAIAPRWDEERVGEILAKTLRLHLAAQTADLSQAELAAARELIAAGERLHQLYMLQRHDQALEAASWLAAQPELEGLNDLFRLFSGPIATTLANEREPFLKVSPEQPGRNVYPHGVTRESLTRYLESNPLRRAELLHPRAVVQAATPANRRRALAALGRHPVLDTLHPGLRQRLQAAGTYIAVPYSVAYADDILFVYARLNAAAAHIEEGDPAFARYLRLRARDLLADDYEGGDAAWVRGQFTGNLNAMIGAYETYDDALFGVKTFFGLSLLRRDRARSAELAGALRDVQRVEDALPYDAHKEVRSDLPVGVYEIVADFGQARGTNTATILPNEAHLVRQYGRTILLRGNILLEPRLFALNEAVFDAAVAARHHGDLTREGMFDRTLWHEIGHYLGPDRAADGRDLDVALQDTADLLEEMKADLVALTAARILHELGRIDAARLRAVQAAGIRRVLQKNRPRRDQPYGTMQLIQWNWLLDQGVLHFDGDALGIDYTRYPAAVEALLSRVLALQRQGARDAAEAFVAEWTDWRADLHERIAARMRAAETARFVLVTYEPLPAEAASGD